MIPRVTLDDLFPRAAFDDEPLPCIWKSAFTDACAFCGRSTHWVDLNFENHVCSMVCDDAAWAEFFYAFAWHEATGLLMQNHTDPDDLEGIGSRQIEEANAKRKEWWNE